MNATGLAGETLRFGVFELDLHSGELRKAGIRIKLQEQPFKVLAALLEHPGKVVKREELRTRIWPLEDFGDFDHAVNIAVAKLRAALGDSPESPRFIETLHRRGYRFIFPIATTGATPGNKVVVTDTDRATSSRSRWVWICAALSSALGVGVTIAWFARPLPPPRVVNTVQVTHDGFDKTNSLTDGSRLYITESTGSKQSLVQISVAGGDTSAIATPFASIAISGISPDGSQMLVADAVGTEGDGQVWVLSLPAGSLRRLGNVVAHWNLWSPGWAVWSPDARQIAFAKDSEIYTVNQDGTDVRKLVTLSGRATEICFSADGSHLRFTLWSPQHDSPSIWDVRADGTNLYPVLPGGQGPPAEIAGAWSHDGRYYFFTRCKDLTPCSIWAIREVAGFFHRRISAPFKLTTSPVPVFLNGVSPDGKRVFAGVWASHSELVRYDPHSHQFRQFLGGISATDLDFSRDGNWVAYVSDPDRSLWRSRADGSERLQLTSPPVSVFMPRWSPDGTQITYSAQANPWKLFLIPAQGGAPKELLFEEQNQIEPSWSPDGKQLAFGRVPWLRASAEKVSLLILDLRSRRVSAIPGSEDLFCPRWSPDGRLLSAVSADNRKLLLFDFKTKKWTDWIREPGTISYPTWSSDGRYIYYDNTSTNSPSYRRVKIGRTESEFLIDLKGLHRGIPSLLGPWSGIAPDGSALFHRDLSTSEIYSLEVDLP